ncbi:hypothetical protein SAMN05216286_1340 [Kosakonia oryzae]|uniref:Uncharacterized protein n=1 Tax=Kosakonia oryzae TaxID=497725 RepID=A0AA94H1L5_9ENTR|nr:hypothetical protein SAMN05216286_1340 [Kosakonia oryzae]
MSLNLTINSSYQPDHMNGRYLFLPIQPVTNCGLGFTTAPGKLFLASSDGNRFFYSRIFHNHPSYWFAEIMNIA